MVKMFLAELCLLSLKINRIVLFVAVSLMSDRPLPSLVASGQKTQWPDFVWIMGPLCKTKAALNIIDMETP